MRSRANGSPPSNKFFDSLRLSPEGRAFFDLFFQLRSLAKQSRNIRLYATEQKKDGCSVTLRHFPKAPFSTFSAKKSRYNESKTGKAEGWTWKNENGRKEPFPWGTSFAGGVRTHGCDGRCAKESWPKRAADVKTYPPPARPIPLPWPSARPSAAGSGASAPYWEPLQDMLLPWAAMVFTTAPPFWCVPPVLWSFPALAPTVCAL